VKLLGEAAIVFGETAECSKPAGLRFRARFASLGLPQGKGRKYAIRRMSVAAMPRRRAHAGSDSLELSAVVGHARFFPD